MNKLVELIPGQVMEFCLMHNPNISLRRLSNDVVTVNKHEGDYTVYTLNIGEEVIDLTGYLDEDVLDDLSNNKVDCLYYRYTLYGENYILLSVVEDNTNEIALTKSFINIVHQAYAIYVNYHKIESVSDAMEYFCRSIMMYNSSIADDEEQLPIPMDDNGTTANTAWARLSSMIQFPILEYTDFN